MADSVTISLLPVSLSLVHIPHARVPDLFHPILRQLLLPKPTFLNVTSNEIELSLFAEHSSLTDFEPIARQDARKTRSLARRRTYNEGEDLKHVLEWEEWSPVEVSSDRWNVLQIDTHSDGLDTSGARVHELSAPLAAAGISILYQSSYMSDFIFVKEQCLADVMSLLGSAGFDLYSSDPEHLTAQLSTLTSPLLPPLADDGSDVSIHLLELAAPPVHPISTENGAVLSMSRSRSSTDASRRTSPQSRAASEKAGEDVDMLGADADPVGEPLAVADSPVAHTNGHSHGHPHTHPSTRSMSHSPSGCDVQVLAPDLTYIGLADENADVWGLKIVKLVAYPDLITGRHVPSRASTHSSSRSPVVRRVEDELVGVSGLGVEVGDARDVMCEPEDEEEDVDDGRSDDTTRVGDSPIDPDHDDPDSRASSASPVFESEQWDADEGRESPQAEDATPVPSFTAIDADADTTRPVLSRIDTDRTHKPAPSHRKRSRSHTHTHTHLPTPPPLVPFFSFTRTPEGSSLTAPVSLLATLFPPQERHMVLCSGELDVLDSRAGSPVRDEDAGEEVEGHEESEDEAEGEMGTLKCLQIDLRKFGLDKHGLVNRYSRTLEENGINHMYSSTYKTANLLVDKRQARRAQALLRSC
ncbi:hypothetical protein EIP86_000298 [Pleurotus ostreatoroseus]|nr:hypothetical protein EIP86_000298 [Pleurotus ostreatoroseus]